LIDGLTVECRSCRTGQVKVVPTSDCVIFWLCPCSVYSNIICCWRFVIA